MLPDFIYWHFSTPAGINVEFITAPVCFSPKLWLELAYQIYSDNHNDESREIGHYASGAPFLHGSDSRISITHTSGMLAIATLPRTPESALIEFSTRTAMGIDAEHTDRRQALKCRSKFLSENEMKLVDAESVEANVLAWTIKEALYKAALCEGIDWRTDLRILQLPQPHDIDNNARNFSDSMLGKAQIVRDGETYEMTLYTMLSENCYITLAYSPKCAKFKSSQKD